MNGCPSLEDWEMRLIDSVFKKGMSQLTKEILEGFESAFSSPSKKNPDVVMSHLKRYRRVVVGCTPQIMPLVEGINILIKEVEKSADADIVEICRSLREKIEEKDKETVKWAQTFLAEEVVCITTQGSSLVERMLERWRKDLIVTLSQGVMGIRFRSQGELNFKREKNRCVLLGVHTLTPKGSAICIKGSLALASLANKRGIPFYLVASTYKVNHFCPEEILKEIVETTPIAQLYCDFVPAELITKIATEKGVHTPKEYYQLGYDKLLV
ncbi:MAG: hypothetical protein QME07_02605 [bacterium]|nr:hypothetical protein [bacterium]